MLKALIFDVDGTLANSEADGHRVAYNRTFREAGLDWRWNRKLYGRLLRISGGRERLRHYLEDRLQGEIPAGPEDPDPFIERLYQAKTRHFISIVEAGKVLPRPGVYRIIVQAKNAGLTLAIASSTDERNVRALLRCAFHQDIEPWFEYIAAGDTVGKKKPAPDIYHRVLAALRLDSKDCLAFEDSAEGLEAAAAAGIPTIVTWNDYTRGDDFSKAALAVNHLDQPCAASAPEDRADHRTISKPIDLDALCRIHSRHCAVFG